METPTSKDITPITSLEDNTAILNDNGYFYSVHTPKTDVWQNELRQIPHNADGIRTASDISNVMRDHENRGFIGIEIKRPGPLAEHWYLTNTYKHGEKNILPAGQRAYSSVSEALTAATKWYQQDPDNRQVTIGKDAYDTLVKEEALKATLSQEHTNNWRKNRVTEAPLSGSTSILKT